MTSPKLQSERLILRKLLPTDVTVNYQQWLADPEVTQFLETRFQHLTLENLKTYVNSLLEDTHQFLFAILLKDQDRHIGNIKLGPIDPRHRFAEMGLLIGEKDCWGKGYATEAIKTVTHFAFTQLNLNKLTAGCYQPNLASIKAFEKAGFIVEGLYKKHFYYQGQYIDAFRLGLIKESDYA